MKKLIGSFILVVPMLACAQVNAPIAFSGINVKTEKEVSLNDFSDKAAVVVLFTGYKCPVDNYYRLRLSDMVKTYENNVAFVFVNSYLETEESIDKMKMETVTHGYEVYLADKEQKIMAALGAKKTPEAFLLKKGDSGFIVVYSGAIDDNPQLPSGVKERYLNNAIDNLLNGKAGSTSVRATGCTIRQH